LACRIDETCTRLQTHKKIILKPAHCTIRIALFVVRCFFITPLFSQPSTVALKWLHGIPIKPIGVSWGVPWPQGQVKKNTSFSITKKDGNLLALQSWSMAYWPDGSVKWTGFASVGDSSATELSLSTVQSKDKPITGNSIEVKDDGKLIHINTGNMQCIIAKSGNALIPLLSINEKTIAANGQLQCILQNAPDDVMETSPVRKKMIGNISQVQIEQTGPVRAVIRLEGKFSAPNGGSNLLPFIVRLYFYAGVQNIRMVHTLLFDGNEQKDFIKGLGLHFDVPLREQVQNRHVRFGGEENGIWAEPVQPLNGRRPSPFINEQVMGKMIPSFETADAAQQNLYKTMATWNDYKLVQSNANGFNIQKRTNGASSWLDAIGGRRASGIVFAGDASGGLSLSLKSFWQSYPAALEVNNMLSSKAGISLWIWSPYADAMDLRHYDTIGHDLNTTYEDLQEVGFSTPHGIGRTSEIIISPYAVMPSNHELATNADETNHTALLVSSPEYLHQVGALGIWSLPDRSTKGKQWIEDQLDKALSFYQQEIDKREWYGFWNYGDVMHSYDAARHSWKYDIGGFAWDNTELSTDIWFWYAFLRSGRADIFTMAEAMTRHTSEVDVYHLGKFNGLGSRHNVNHWGDGSKEVRESQAILRRYYYYLTTDERTGNIMHEATLNADSGLLHVDPLREILPKTVYPTHARFGPDWLSLVGNWMTEWERTGDTRWKSKILTGVRDFAAMPYGFYSGKNKDAGMGYDPRTNHIYQLNPNDIGSSHLAALMGGMEMAYELAPLMNDADFNRLYLQYCKLYGAPLEEVQAAFGKEIKTTLGDPQGDFAREPAYVYYLTKDAKYAKRAWDQFLPSTQRLGGARFEPQLLKGPMVVKSLYEIRNVSTNATAQWCLNAIELLQLAGDAIPEHHPVWDK
jgi:hypothetical protein